MNGTLENISNRIKQDACDVVCKYFGKDSVKVFNINRFDDANDVAYKVFKSGKVMNASEPYKFLTEFVNAIIDFEGLEVPYKWLSLIPGKLLTSSILDLLGRYSIISTIECIDFKLFPKDKFILMYKEYFKINEFDNLAFNLKLGFNFFKEYNDFSILDVIFNEIHFKGCNIIPEIYNDFFEDDEAIFVIEEIMSDDVIARHLVSIEPKVVFYMNHIDMDVYLIAKDVIKDNLYVFETYILDFCMGEHFHEKELPTFTKDVVMMMIDDISFDNLDPDLTDICNISYYITDDIPSSYVSLYISKFIRFFDKLCYDKKYLLNEVKDFFNAISKNEEAFNDVFCDLVNVKLFIKAIYDIYFFSYFDEYNDFLAINYNSFSKYLPDDLRNRIIDIMDS